MTTAANLVNPVFDGLRVALNRERWWVEELNAIADSLDLIATGSSWVYIGTNVEDFRTNLRRSVAEIRALAKGPVTKQASENNQHWAVAFLDAAVNEGRLIESYGLPRRSRAFAWT